MSDNLSLLLKRYREAVVCILGSHLKRIVLYGSYARGIIDRIQIWIL